MLSNWKGIWLLEAKANAQLHVFWLSVPGSSPLQCHPSIFWKYHSKGILYGYNSEFSSATWQRGNVYHWANYIRQHQVLCTWLVASLSLDSVTILTSLFQQLAQSQLQLSSSPSQWQEAGHSLQGANNLFLGVWLLLNTPLPFSVSVSRESLRRLIWKDL